MCNSEIFNFVEISQNKCFENGALARCDKIQPKSFRFYFYEMVIQSMFKTPSSHRRAPRGQGRASASGCVAFRGCTAGCTLRALEPSSLVHQHLSNHQLCNIYPGNIVLKTFYQDLHSYLMTFPGFCKFSHLLCRMSLSQNVC